MNIVGIVLGIAMIILGWISTRPSNDMDDTNSWTAWIMALGAIILVLSFVIGK